MTFPSDHPEPSPREDLPQGLQSDLKRAYDTDEIQPPSRVDDAVFAAAGKHFGEAASSSPASQAEPKPGVLARLGRKPLQSAGLAGALIAASVLLVVFIGGPNQRPSANERSIAMDLAMEPEADVFSDSAEGIASREFGEGARSRRSAEGTIVSEQPFPRGGGGSGSAIPSQNFDAARDEDSMYGLHFSELADGEAEAVSAPPSPSAYPEPSSKIARQAKVLAKGDVNGDGSVNIADALLLARMVDDAGGSLDDLRYDLLGNGTVSRADADAIARLVVRLAPVPENTNPEGAS